MSSDSHNQASEHAGAAVPATECYNDVQDCKEDLDRYSATLPLQACPPVVKAFTRCDDAAVDFQNKHGRLVVLAAFFGTAAVVLAILGLGTHNMESLLWKVLLLVLEPVAATIAGVAVLRGIKKKFKERWLLQRYCAEQLRLLKYRFLLRPDVWKGTSEQTQRLWLEAEIGKITDLAVTMNLHQAVTQPTPHGPFEGIHTRLSKKEVGDLVQYYAEKRLGPQKEYLANRAQRNEFKDQIRELLPKMFLWSILVVFAKGILELVSLWLEHHHEAVEAAKWIEISVLLGALCAALLPTIAAGIRLKLSAGEFARNKSRFESAHKALKKLQDSLFTDTLAIVGKVGSSQPAVNVIREQEFVTGSGYAEIRVRTEQRVESAGSDTDEIDAYTILRDLNWCEHILDAEHREWLRLMYDAEWFG